MSNIEQFPTKKGITIKPDSSNLAFYLLFSLILLNSKLEHQKET